MLLDVEENNNLDFEKSVNSKIDPSVLNKLQNEINNMGISLKINVQLLSKKNDLQMKQLLQSLSADLNTLLVENNKQVSQEELFQIVYRNLYQDLMCENERLFRMEYDLTRNTNEILHERLEFILNHYDYQNCLINMNSLIEHFRVGVKGTNRTIDLRDKIQLLTYDLAVAYKLHSDIKLYMQVQKHIDSCKDECSKVFEYSLNELQMENLKNAIQVRDTLSSMLQEIKFQTFSEGKQLY